MKERAAHRRAELRIRLTGDEPDALPVRDVLEAIESSVAILRELERSESGRSSLDWRVVACSMKSPLTMDLSASAVRGTVPPMAVVHSFLTSIVGVNEGRAPDYFPDSALGDAKRLGSLLKRGLRRIDYLRGRKVLASPVPAFESRVEAVLRERTTVERTTVEGRLEVLNAHGKPRFAVYHVVTGARTVCEADPGVFSEAYGHFNKRVAVTGMARVDRAGRPVSMYDVERVERLPERSELPQFGDVEGAKITGGVDAAEYVRRLRDGR